MRTFHLSCPYTSLTICHCRLFCSAPAKYTRNPFKPSRRSVVSGSDKAQRRAQLLQIMCSASAPPGTSQTESPTLINAMYARAMHGYIASGDGGQVHTHMVEQQAELSSVVDLEDEDAFAAATDRFKEAQDELNRAEEELQNALNNAKHDGVDTHDLDTTNDQEEKNCL